MLEILEQIITTLTGDATLTGIVSANSIYTGPVDTVLETQSELAYPMLTIHVVSEAQRTNPLNTRDTQVQIDIWSRNSQLELENIYERLVTLMGYDSYDKSTAHVFWSRLESTADLYESDRRIWHRACTFKVWSLK